MILGIATIVNSGCMEIASTSISPPGPKSMFAGSAPWEAVV